jgi:hypothetical protein
MGDIERHVFQNTEHMYHCFIMDIFNKRLNAIKISPKEKAKHPK